MGYRQAKMLEDINGDLIPQYWDAAERKFKPLTNDPQDVRLTGSRVEISSIISDEIPGGSVSNVHRINDISKYKKLDIMVYRGNSDTNDFTVSLNHLVNPQESGFRYNNLYSLDEDLFEKIGNSDNTALALGVPIRGNGIQVRVANLGDTPSNYRVLIWGRS